MILRIALLVVLLAASFGVVSRLERRRGRARAGFGPGLTLVTGDGCRLCGPAAAALAAAGAVPTVVDIASLRHRTVSSVPTAIVTDRSGKVLLRRSGRAVAEDAAALASAARGV